MSDDSSLRKSLELYKGLVEVSGLINSITDYDELLKAVLDVSRRVIHAEAASLFLVNEESGFLELVMAQTGDAHYVEPRLAIPKGRGIAGWVFERGEAILIPDAYADPRFYKEADRQTGFVTRSILCAPLVSEGRVKGVLQVLNPSGKERFEAEDLEGFIAYANLTATALEKTRSIERMREQERLGRDVAIASEIQREILSRAIPRSTPGAVFAAHNEPAANVGGDFFEVFVRPGGEIFFAIGDVSGKGITASLLMAQVVSAMDFVFASAASPADALARLNATLSQRVVRGMFVTSLVGCFHPPSREVRLASAGHCPPVIIRSNGAVDPVEVEGALPLGVMPGRTYAECAVTMQVGDCLVAFTDGLTESRNAAGDLFDPQIVAALHGTVGGPSAAVERLLEAERSHRGHRPKADDLTILAAALS